MLNSLVDDCVASEDQWFDQDGLDFLKIKPKKENFDLEAPIDIYQNIQTGAMVYIPARISRNSITIENNNVLVVDGGRTKMYLQIVKGKSFAEAKQKKNRFLTYLNLKHGVKNGQSTGIRSGTTMNLRIIPKEAIGRTATSNTSLVPAIRG